MGSIVKTAEDDELLEVLVVEDSATQAELLCHILEVKGYGVCVATNGAEAYRKLLGQPDKSWVVVSDIMMPEMDGFELCSRIRAHDELKDTPVILLTSLQDPTDVIRGLECGANNFLVKPLQEKPFLYRLQQIVANIELRKKSNADMGLNVFFGGRNYFISSNRLQILDLLLSTYETAYHKNQELARSRDELRLMTESLEELVTSRTDELRAQMLERQLAEEKLRSITDTALDAIISIDRHGLIDFMNPAGEKIFGYQTTEIVGGDARSMIASKYQDSRLMLALERFGPRLVRYLRVRHLECDAVRKDGSEFPAELSLSACRHCDEWKMVVVVRDITKHKQIVAQLETSCCELKTTQAQMLQREKMASIGQLAAGVAHEINNPIGFVLSNLGTLSRYVERMIGLIGRQSEMIEQLATDEMRAEIEEMKRQAKLDYILSDCMNLIAESQEGGERVRKIVRDLKNFSRVDSADYQQVDLVTCLESTLNIAWNELKYKVTLHKEYGTLPPVRCYPQQLNQVFLNLLINATNAIEGRGEVTVRVWHESEYAFFSVADTGCGIPEQILPRIFEPFFTTKEVGKGTGLGLSISYDIVKKHGGELTVESEVGKGSNFIVKVPLEGRKLEQTDVWTASAESM